LEIFPNDAQNISKHQNKNINPKILIKKIIKSNKRNLEISLEQSHQAIESRNALSLKVDLCHLE
jgi:hypothetical protein